MKSQERKISDVIDKIIKENGSRILLKAGLGSGKTYMAICYLPKLGKTLYITSRATIKEQAINLALGLPEEPMFNLDPHSDTADLTIIHQWNIQKAILEHIREGRYDYIIIDEIHLLTSDSFAEAPYYVGKFISLIPENTCLIMMSACADQVREYIDANLKIKYAYVDISSEVDNVKPKSAKLFNYMMVERQLLTANSHCKMIYFCATTDNVYQLERLLRDKGVRALAITSQPGNRDKEDHDYNNKEREALDYINFAEKLPPDVDVVVTTSKLREGVNLKDENIKSVFSELKDSVSIMQCAGRVRHGVEVYGIVMDKGNIYPRFDPSVLEEARKAVYSANMIMNLRSVPGFTQNIDSIVSFDPLKERYRNLIIRDGDLFVINDGLVFDIIKRQADYVRFREQPEQFVTSLLGMGVEPLPTIDEIVKPYSGRKLRTAECNELIEKANYYGFEGKQMSKILKNSDFTCSRSRNGSRTTITSRD